jgi:DNA recombination protein RmuC
MDLTILAIVLALLALALVPVLIWVVRPRAADTGPLQAKMTELAQLQAQIAGRFSQAIESQSKSQGELTRAVNERLEALDSRLGANLKETAAKTAETLGKLQTRLNVIDEAQKNLTDLSSQVVGLQQILANKQTRGAYGQGQMEAIVSDALPAGMYEFQWTLSNRTRPDCYVRVPNSKTGIVIDSKFPLEGFEQLKAATSEAERKTACARIRTDVLKHVKDIADKYLIAGETQEPAIMFVPSESLYAELHDGFDDVIQQAYRLRVAVVSPTILMLAVNTVTCLMKDARMREQANLIQREVGLMLDDVNRLFTRATKLQNHFGAVQDDVKGILISAEKVAQKAAQIEKVDVEATPKTVERGAPTLFSRAG